MQTTEVIPNVLYEPFQAVAWLLSRHETAQHLVDRVGSWIDTANVDGPGRLPDLDTIAEGLRTYDRHGVEWKAYEEAHPPPRPHRYGDDDEAAYERAYEKWENAGPRFRSENPDAEVFAAQYAPMSSGEKRFFRLLAIFSPGYRTAFQFDDTSGVGLSCCAPGFYGAPRPHTPFVQDWAELISRSAANR